MEHRWGNRLEVRRPVRLRTRGGLLSQGVVSNVSISGALIVTPMPVQLLSYVCVQIVVEDRRIHAQIEGQVVRCTASGFAMEWCDFAPDAIRELTAYFETVDDVTEQSFEHIATGARRLR